MKITKASYGRTYSLGSFQSERIDLEATIDEGEDIQFVVCNLKHECDQIHQKNNPHLYQEQETTIPIDDKYKQFRDTPISEHLEKQRKTIESKKLSQKELITQEIYNAKTLKALSEWKLLSDKYPDLKEIYQNKLNQLTND